jgi:hypothetical protein
MSHSPFAPYSPSALDAISVAAFSAEREREATNPTLPLRLHLLNQLLLI